MKTAATIVAHAEGDEVHIRLGGEIDLANVADVEAELTAPITNRCKVVRLDLTDVRYVDSAGLRVVAALARRLRRSQIKFRTVAPPGSPARLVLELSGMTGIVPIEPQEPSNGSAGDEDAGEDDDSD